MSQFLFFGFNGFIYVDVGVDIDVGNVLVDCIKLLVKVIFWVGVDSDIGGFGGLFDFKGVGFIDLVLVVVNDGVGIKFKIVIEIGRYCIVGIDLVVMCVNDFVVQGVEFLFFFDYFVIGVLYVDMVIDVVVGIVDGCKLVGVVLIGGEIVEMLGMYVLGDYDFVGFFVGVVECGVILLCKDVGVGDVFFGFVFFGVYLNGYLMVCKIVELIGLNWFVLVFFVEGMLLGEVFMELIWIYVKLFLVVLKVIFGIKVLVYIIGGGLLENLLCVFFEVCFVWIDFLVIKVLLVFFWLVVIGGVFEFEMLCMFNCGVGMVIVVVVDEVEVVMEVLIEIGEIVIWIGQIELVGFLFVFFDGVLGLGI